MTSMSRPERWAHKAQVMSNQCRACQYRVHIGSFDGTAVFDCAQNLSPPCKRVCPGFVLDEDTEEP